jgi:hypothetical protein
MTDVHNKKTRSYNMKKNVKKLRTKKEQPSHDKEFFAKFKGILKGGGNLLNELKDEKKEELENENRKFGIRLTYTLPDVTARNHLFLTDGRRA